MRFRPLIAPAVAAAACLLLLPVQGKPVMPDFSMDDAVRLHHLACIMLEDEAYQNVSGVPDMLQQSWDRGYAPAGLTLLDVYEGRHKGLEAAPAEACQFAKSVVEMTPAEGEELTPEQQNLRKEALFRLAGYREKGWGCTRDLRAAYTYMEQAASLGLAKAQAELARYQMNGTGCEPSPEAALRQLVKLHQQAPDTPNLYYYLGHMCYHGLGLKRPQIRQAIEFYKLGIRHHDANAANNLGAILERGTPVSKRNLSGALRLYHLASSWGNREASANLQRLEFHTRIKGGTHDTSSLQKIANGLQRLIVALPLSHPHKRALIRQLQGSTPPLPNAQP